MKPFLRPFAMSWLMLCASASAQSIDSIAQNIPAPHVHGTVRGRWESDIDAHVSRFKVRNARVSLDGNIHPTIDYYMQVDLCQGGKVTFLDGWGRIAIDRHWKIQAGQFRTPLGNDPFRGPHTYIFANRSYLGRYLCNIRAAGVKAAYCPLSFPATIEAGIFNPTTINDVSNWHKTYTYAGRAILSPGQWRFDFGMMSVKPADVRINLWDAGIAWKQDRWEMATEYMYRHYTNDAHPATHAWLVWSNYTMPVKWGVFNRFSIQGRYDGMNDFTDTESMENGSCSTTACGRQRLTAGATISYRNGPVWLDLRAQYEKIWLDSNYNPKVPGQGDRATVEMVLRF